MGERAIGSFADVVSLWCSECKSVQTVIYHNSTSKAWLKCGAIREASLPAKTGAISLENVNPLSAEELKALQTPETIHDEKLAQTEKDLS
jgi:hypothetical protein